MKHNSPYSSGREASGLLHLVGILSALYDDEVGVLLIDEPEVSLHPQLQAFLLKEISRVAGIPSDENYQKNHCDSNTFNRNDKALKNR